MTPAPRGPQPGPTPWTDTMSVIMMGRPYVISLVDSMRMTVRLMVILTTPPRKAAAPIRANVPE